MIYTAYEMVRDCRANRREGWSYFVSNYVPVIRKLLAHYAPGGGHLLPRVLRVIVEPESSVFASLEPAPERWFVAELRQKVLAQLEVKSAEAEIDLETVAVALAPLTVVEKQAAWFETMHYSAAETATMLRMAPATVEKIRAKAGELTRGKVETWRSGMLRDNGLGLGRAAARNRGEDCLPSKSFLDVLDGRTTWREREQMESHVTSCWHCIDHFCRMAEVIELLRGAEPLPKKEAEQLLGTIRAQ